MSTHTITDHHREYCESLGVDPEQWREDNRLAAEAEEQCEGIKPSQIKPQAKGEA